jgi:hypothetical protein
MDEEAYMELTRRCEALYDRIVRDEEEARSTSIHSLFANAVNDFVVFLDGPNMTDDKKMYVETLLNKLTPIAMYGERLHRELLVIGDSDEQMNADVFDVSIEKARSIEENVNAYLSEFIEKSYNDDYPFNGNPKFLGMDLSEFYCDVVPGLRCWQLGTAAGMTASSNWNIMPWHWTCHLFRAMFSLNALKHLDV